MEKEFIVNNVKVTYKGYDCDITEDMAKSALSYANENKENEAFVISEIVMTKGTEEEGDDMELIYHDEDQPKFGRIRRITGYLTGTTDRWNSAKRAELKDRVTHI